MKRLSCLIILTVTLSIGCATDNKVSQNGSTVSFFDQRMTAERLVKNLFFTYQKFTLNAFSDKVADDFVPLRSEFINTASQNAHQGDILDINFSLEEVLPNKELLAVGVKWQKRVRPSGSSSATLTEGQAEMVFKNQQGRWLLYKVTGTSPF